MRRYQAALAAACVSLVASSLVAQPVLDKVEQQLRQGTPGAAAPGGAAPAFEPGYLGVIADDRNEQGSGIRILEVVATGPAAAAGLKVGDLITGIDRQPITKVADMGQILQRLPTGAKLEFQVTRDGAEQRIPVTLSQRPATGDRRFQTFGRQPEAAPEAAPGAGPDNAGAPLVLSGGPKLGVRTVPVTEDAARQYRLPAASGALVTTVVVGSVAEKAGIPLGAVIVGVNDQPIAVPDDLATAIRRAGSGAEIEITYYSKGEQQRRRLNLPIVAAGGADVRPELPGPPGAALPPFGAPPPLLTQPAGESDAGRIEALEKRIRDLEARLERLERKGTE